ncbi:MAG: hypothetical protein K5979_13105 [Ruminococcus sp.]|nr:hypothetical protein [Ruminococcus sp.]
MKYENELKNTLIKIISDSEMQNKEVWKDVAAALADYEKAKLDEISLSVEGENFGRGMQKNCIHAMLWDVKNTMLPPDYSYVSEADDELMCGYLDCSYEDAKTLYHRVFHGSYMLGGKDRTEFDYQLVKSFELIDEEKEIFRFAEFNRTDLPMIYAPCFRRFAYIKPVDRTHKFSESELKTVDLDLGQDPLLSRALKLGHRAVWNVHINDSLFSDEKKEIQSEQSRRTEKLFRYTYQLPENKYILFDAERLSDLDIAFGQDCVYVTTELESIEHVKLLTVYTPLQKAEMRMGFDGSKPLPRRICTLSDIYDAVGRFSFYGSRNEYERLPEPKIDTSSAPDLENTVVCEYDRKDRYAYSSLFFESSMKLSKVPERTVYLLFEASDDELLYDKIVYIVSWFKMHYPEFSWKGGIKK